MFGYFCSSIRQCPFSFKLCSKWVVMTLTSNKLTTQLQHEKNSLQFNSLTIREIQKFKWGINDKNQTLRDLIRILEIRSNMKKLGSSIWLD